MRSVTGRNFYCHFSNVNSAAQGSKDCSKITIFETKESYYPAGPSWQIPRVHAWKVARCVWGREKLSEQHYSQHWLQGGWGFAGVATDEAVVVWIHLAWQTCALKFKLYIWHHDCLKILADCGPSWPLYRNNLNVLYLLCPCHFLFIENHDNYTEISGRVPVR